MTLLNDAGNAQRARIAYAAWPQLEGAPLHRGVSEATVHPHAAERSYGV